MRKLQCISFAVCLILCLPASGIALETASKGFQVGFASADITPPVGWRRAGNYTELISDGVQDPLLTKAMVVEEGKTTYAFVGTDVAAVPRELTTRARKLASERTGIPFQNIVITATHTHGAPEYYGPLRDFLHERAKAENQGKDPREPMDYQKFIVDKWVDVVVRAQAKSKPASLEITIPEQPSLAFNRRYWMKDGSVGWNPGRLNPNIWRPAGPTDLDLPFIVARDAVTKQPLGSLTVFALHTAVYKGAPFSADFPGHLQINLQAVWGTNFISIFGEGCAGNVNHINTSSGDPQSWTNHTPLIGRTLANTILTNLVYSSPVQPGSFAVRSLTIKSPVTPISDSEYADARKIMETLDRNGADFLTAVDAWRKMFQHQFWEQHGGQYPEEIQVVRFDADTALVTLPHEVFVELGMAIKSASPFRRTVVVSLANDLDIYIPDRRAFEQGNYEPTTCPLKSGCGELLVEGALKLLNELKPTR